MAVDEVKVPEAGDIAASVVRPLGDNWPETIVSTQVVGLKAVSS